MKLNADKSDRLFKKQVLALNRHVPRQRKNLKELLDEERPHVIGADGNRHRFKWAELDLISGLLSPEEHARLKLPIYIEIESMTSGARISGQLENKIVCNVLGLEECDYGTQERFIYRPEIKELRKKLPTVTQYIFLVK